LDGPVYNRPNIASIRKGFPLIRYAITIFLSAFLLFQVQPMVARFILPWFGGSSLVWTTCMLFFQVFLVAGYAYSHVVSKFLSPRAQWILHLVIVLAAVAILPIRPVDSWKPLDGNMPTTRILILLAANVGLPFFILSTTGPLIQKWQSLTHPDRSPFRLFALSNFVSLLALISYPFVVERFLTVDQQSWLWSGTFLAFAVSVAYSGFVYQRTVKRGSDAAGLVNQTSAQPQQEKAVATSSMTILLWIVLPMLASIQLLATTNFMTQEIGSHPFLWILPLALYLISFIICFDHERWYYRPLFFTGLVLSSIYACSVLAQGLGAGVLEQIVSYAAVSFFSAMCCHGELAKIKPPASQLTLFYLLISVGGALGGIMIALVAPVWLPNYYEFHICLIAVLLVCVGTFVVPKLRDWKAGELSAAMQMGVRLSCFSAVVVTGYLLYSFGKYISKDFAANVLTVQRNEYGVLKVSNGDYRRVLYNGHTLHGFQVNEKPTHDMPTSYYSPSSGLGQAIAYLQTDEPKTKTDGMSVGAIGLGTGTIAAWGRSQDTIRFYEINPKVVEMAENYFDYLSNCKSKLDISLGDARIQLERETQRNDPKYDLVVADAFSSDSIPMHLLTLEAVQLYQSRLKDGGIIALHTSNRYLRLENVVKRLGTEIGFQAVLIDDNSVRDTSETDDGDNPNSGSKWVLLTKNQAFLDSSYVKDNTTAWPDEKYSAFWTDDSSSLLPVMH